MFTVYILRGDNAKLYKGMTNNLPRRIKEHKLGETATTARMKNLQVVYTEEYSTFREARLREVYFKTAAGRRFLKTKMQLPD